MTREGRRCFLAAALAVLSACHAASRPPYDEGRLSQEAMEALVAEPIKAVRAGRLTEAFAQVDALRAARAGATRDPFARADVDEAFGVRLYMESDGADARSIAAARYLARATAEYRAALGPKAPEVALALMSQADLLLYLSSAENAPVARGMYCEAYAIWRDSLGRYAPDTGAALAAVARTYPRSEATLALEEIRERVGYPSLTDRAVAVMTGRTARLENERRQLRIVARDPRFASLCARTNPSP